MATSLPFDSIYIWATISVEVFDKQLRTEFGKIRPRFDIISLPFSKRRNKNATLMYSENVSNSFI